MPNNAKNIRKCVVCKEHSDKSELLRIVKDKNGNIVIDNEKKVQGRGIYVHKCAKCIEILKKKKMLSFLLKANDDDIYEEL